MESETLAVGVEFLEFLASDHIRLGNYYFSTTPVIILTSFLIRTHSTGRKFAASLFDTYFDTLLRSFAFCAWCVEILSLMHITTILKRKNTLRNKDSTNF